MGKSFHGMLIAAWNAVTGSPEDVEFVSGMMKVSDGAVHPGDDATLDRNWGGGKCVATAPLTADTLVFTGANAIAGYVVHVATATAIIEIRDSTTAGGGTVRVTIPIGKAVGEYIFPQAIECTAGIFLDYAATATGTISVLRTKA